MRGATVFLSSQQESISSKIQFDSGQLDSAFEATILSIPCQDPCTMVQLQAFGSRSILASITFVRQPIMQGDLKTFSGQVAI